ncbi:hypothetical protein B1B_19073, partial [mine drainage metagenome]
GATAAELHAPIVSVSKSSMDSYISSLTDVSYSCVAYNIADPRNISQIYRSGDAVGLYESNRYGSGAIVPYSSQDGPIKFVCGTMPVQFSNGSKGYEAYTTAVNVGNTTVRENLNNSIVVYKTARKRPLLCRGRFLYSA